MQTRRARLLQSQRAACVNSTLGVSLRFWLFVVLCCGTLAPALDTFSSAQAPASASLSSGADALYQQSLTLMHGGRLAEAQRLLVQARGEAPQDMLIAVTLGKLDALLGNSAEAVVLFREVEAKDPENTENQVNLAIALAQQGNFEEALIPATKAVTRSPKSASAHHIRARVLSALHRNEPAQQDFQAALALSPTDPLTLYDDAQFCEETGNLAEEVQLLRRLITSRPASAPDHFLLARALSRTGHQDDAISEYQTVIRLNPDNRPALYSLSRLLQAKDPAQAAALASRFRSLEISEDDLNAIRSQGNQGVIAMQSRDWIRAISLFQNALASCGECTLQATLEKDLGLAECQSGDANAGILSLRRSLALDPRDLDTVRAIEVAEKTRSSAKKVPDQNTP